MIALAEKTTYRVAQKSKPQQMIKKCIKSY